MSLNADGWTVVTPALDSRIVYVSSSAGNDQNGGLSPAAPVGTLARAYSLVRAGLPDQVLLKRGDTWTTPFPRWQKSGRSADEPILVGTYGSGSRPIISTGAVSSAFEVTGSVAVSYLNIQGLQFYSAARDPNALTFDPAAVSQQYSGLRWYAPTNGFTVEDCSFRFYSDNIDVEGVNSPIHNALFRRVVSTDSYNTTKNSQGMYGFNIDGLIVEQSVFDHNGWNEQVAGAGQTGHNHNLYFSYSVINGTFRQNIIANGSNNGLLARGGGVIEDNLFVDNPSAISYGGAPGSLSTPGGVKGSITGNVIAGNRSLGDLQYGYGINIANTAPGTPTLVAGNIFTGDTQQSKPAIAFEVDYNTLNPDVAVGINDVVIQKNIFNHWYRAIQSDPTMLNDTTGIGAFNRVTIRDNDLQFSSNVLVRHAHPFSTSAETWSGNRYFDNISGGSWFNLNGQALTASQWIAQIDPTGMVQRASYPEPDRTAATYSAFVGGAGTVSAFLSAARSQSSDRWDLNYVATTVNDFIRAGFDAAAVPTATAEVSSIDADDVPPPGASGAGADTPYTFTVAYADKKGLDLSGIGNGDAHVVGPRGFDVVADVVSVTAESDSKSAVATYTITPPGGRWTYAMNGTYSVEVGTGQVRNVAGIGVSAAPVGSFSVSAPLDLIGTAGVDRIALVALPLGRMLLIKNGARSVQLRADVPQIRISAGDGNDLIFVGPGLANCVIDGGAGNDRILGGTANDTITGGDGADLIADRAGRNLLLGGAGDDRIVGGINDDLIYGADGTDLLVGGFGDDVLIGGDGADAMADLAGTDLLIAGSASTADPAALLGVLNAWANGRSYRARVDSLSPIPGNAVAVGGVTFSDDSSTDRLFGGLGLDWFLTKNDTTVGRTALEEITSL